MGDDYEILDPTKAASTFDNDPAPETPILSSRLESVTPGSSDPAVVDKKSGKEKEKKVILQKKDAEVQFEQRKGSKKTSDKQSNDNRLFDKGKKQGKSDQLIDEYEYESIASAIRRALLITTAFGFLICIFYSALGIAYLICLFSIYFELK